MYVCEQSIQGRGQDVMVMCSILEAFKFIFYKHKHSQHTYAYTYNTHTHTYIYIYMYISQWLARWNIHTSVERTSACSIHAL